MIAPAKAGGSIHHAYRRRLLDDTHNGRVTPQIEAELAGIRLRRRSTDAAGPHPLRDRREDGGETDDLLWGLLKQMIRQSLSGFPADSRQPGKLSDQFLNRGHRSERQVERKWLHFPHLRLENILCPTLGLGHGRRYQIGQQLGIPLGERDRVNGDRANRSPAIGGHLHQARASGCLDGPGGQFSLNLLQPALHLLAQLEKLLKICHEVCKFLSILNIRYALRHRNQPSIHDLQI
jgi:hypothetical protein